MKKIATILILMFLLTGVSLSQEIIDDLIVGDFEDCPGQWPAEPNWAPCADGWEIYTYFSHGGAGVTLSQSTIGATLGNYSLKYECPAEPYFHGLLIDMWDNGYFEIYDEETRLHWINDGFFAHRSFSMDITIDPADWEEDISCTLEIVYNTNGTSGPWGGGYGFQGAPDTDSVNPGNPSYWDAETFPVLQTRTVSWDITPQDHIDHAEWRTPANPTHKDGTFFQLIFVVFTNGNGRQKATFYLDNIRFTTRYTSYAPKPYDTAQDLNLLPKLGWTPGVFATSHDVYFGTNFNEVNEATADNHPNVTLTNVDVNELAITENLEFSTPYYWRVDDKSDTTFVGPVWTFTTGRYSLIDDFESYPTTNKANDDSRIFVTWRDKYSYRDANNNRIAGNGTGMTVGTDNKPETDPDFVYHGDQSLPLTYDNTKDPYKSETDRTFDPPYDFSTVNNQALETLDLQILGRYLVNNGYTLDNGQYTIIGSGNDIFGLGDNNYEDEFFFVYQQEPLEGRAGSISAQIVSLERTDPAAKAGVMIRDNLGGPVDPGAVFAGVFSLPTGDIVFQYRNARGQASEVVRPEDHEFILPYWVRISIADGTVTAEMSADGENWEQIGEPTDISMYNYTVMGLVVTSHRNAGVPCTAVLSDVKLDIAGDTSYTLNASNNIGLEKNDPANIYVRLEDSSGQTDTAHYEDDPNGVFVDPYDIEWKLFSIPLSEFDEVDLTQIEKMVIGIGDGQSVGEGKIYVDDVRLTLPPLPDPNEGE